MQNLCDKKIGIWGLGSTGKSAIKFFAAQGAHICAFDDRITDAQRQFAVQHKVTLAPSAQHLIEENDYIMPSPGIDIRPYFEQYRGKWIFELDLFAQHFRKPIIAITGSVGKTTVTHLITQLLQEAGWRVQAGGNIGTPVFEFISQQENLDAIVLEISSFQLEYCTQFAPDLAVWTNLFPNHLDRHGTMEQYFDAKYIMIKNQRPHQKALLPLALRDQIENQKPQSSMYYFDVHSDDTSVYTLNKNNIVHQKKLLISLDSVASITYPINWLIAYSALDVLGVPARPLHNAPTLEHRLEKVATVNGVTFYNDSKSTIAASTLTALNTITAPRIMLFLGGLSKGTDRSPLVQALSNKNVRVFCFGKEAPLLHNLCTQYRVTSTACASLDEAFNLCIQEISPGDCVLFSPAGSSYDLFANYQDRGAYFKKQVLAYQNKTGEHDN